MFGLTNGEGNHGEDVKEYWFYLDSTPTHSYLKCQYKYPQRAFPYEDLVATNRQRGKQDMEYELLDTGDLRRGPLLRRGRRVRQGRARRHPDAGHRPQPRPRARRRCTCSRRCGSATHGRGATASPSRRCTRSTATPARASRITELGEWRFTAEDSAQLLFCENETNNQRLFGAPNASPYVKDGINDYVVGGRARRRQPGADGHQGARPTTCSSSRAGESAQIRVRLTGSSARATASRSAPTSTRSCARAPGRGRRVLRDASSRRRSSADEAMVMRQALAGPAVGQAVLRVRRAPLAARARRRPVGSERARDSVRNVAVVPHGRRRHHLDARQVGVPVVRRLGPGVPLRAAVAGRRRLRQGAGRAAARAPATCTPTARSRPTSGTSATSTRR